MPRRDVMLAKPFISDRQISSWPYVFLQPKINGIRCRATKSQMFSSQANEIVAFPELQQLILEALASFNQISPTFDGEIYSRELSFQSLSGLARTKHHVAPIHQICYIVFDLISDTYQEDRIALLQTFHNRYRDKYSVEFIETTACLNTDLNVIDSMFDKCIRSGYEGIILRNPEALYQTKRTGDLLKLKATQTAIFPVDGITELLHQDGSRGRMLGALRCLTESNKTFHVGSGFTQYERISIWNAFRDHNVLPAKLRVRFAGLTDANIPFHPIVKEIIWQ